jgi:predicted Zn-dependent protease
LQEQQTANILGTGLSIFTHGKYDSVIGAGTNLFLLGHSRNDEYDADRRGVNTLMRANVNPVGMVNFFQKLEAKYKDGSKITEYTQTHPLTEERIQRVQEQIQWNQVNGVPLAKSG